MSLRCLIGLHRGYTAHRGHGTFRWCLRCGRTWEATYDLLSHDWRVRHDLYMGRVREDGE